MSPRMQVKLLRVLQEREVQPVGSAQVVPIDIRLVCATNRRLREEVGRGAFREDLFYRVGVIEIAIPPLRERLEDVPALARHVLARVSAQLGREPPELTRAALRKLVSYAWPGNVRQLENVLTKALVLADASTISPADIDLPASSIAPASDAAVDRTRFDRMEASRVMDSLVAHRWNVSEVARALGIPRATLYRKLRRWGLVRKTGAPSDA